MIQKGSRLKVIDNTGAIRVRCIGIDKLSKASIGDLITVSVEKAYPDRKVKRREVHRALIVRTVRGYLSPLGFKYLFGDNAVILIKKGEGVPLGTRISGIVSSELRAKGYLKVVSLSTGVF